MEFSSLVNFHLNYSFSLWCYYFEVPHHENHLCWSGHLINMFELYLIHSGGGGGWWVRKKSCPPISKDQTYPTNNDRSLTVSPLTFLVICVFWNLCFPPIFWAANHMAVHAIYRWAQYRFPDNMAQFLWHGSNCDFKTRKREYILSDWQIWRKFLVFSSACQLYHLSWERELSQKTVSA